ncbi:MAG: hypothetical protein CFE34_06710 [Rhodobacteraceae bacterium PARR1]|nr:MAG: hypothetical protein CFE34_06710 [Rhodobacteraceae bacterium PARR1]
MHDNDPLPPWLRNRTVCHIKDLMQLFEVSRSTIDRWSRDVPAFPKKVKITYDPILNAATRFMVDDVRAYVRSLGISGAEKKE